jgi:hypothetical protein
VTPREIVAILLGLIVGCLITEMFPSACRRACCMDEDAKARRKERWIRGQEFENHLPPARLKRIGVALLILAFCTAAWWAVVYVAILFQVARDN